MALTQGDVLLWSKLRELGAIPPKPAVLEIGEANWFNDSDPPAGCAGHDLFDVARNFYQKFLDYSVIVSVDLQGPTALRLDLNKRIYGHELSRATPFDIVINSGTTEHIFDQRQVFETIHDCCKPCGLMIHAAPVGGWQKHGLYIYGADFFDDLAKANHYEILEKFWYDLGKESPTNTLIYIAFRKTKHAPFKVPMQSKLGL